MLSKYFRKNVLETIFLFVFQSILGWFSLSFDVTDVLDSVWPARLQLKANTRFASLPYNGCCREMSCHNYNRVSYTDIERPSSSIEFWSFKCDHGRQVWLRLFRDLFRAGILIGVKRVVLIKISFWCLAVEQSKGSGKGKRWTRRCEEWGNRIFDYGEWYCEEEEYNVSEIHVSRYEKNLHVTFLIFVFSLWDDLFHYVVHDYVCHCYMYFYEYTNHSTNKL